MLNLGQRIIELRKAKNISQAKLAKALEVSFGIVCYWETNRAEPTASNIIKLAKFFDVSSDFLLGLED